jgi:signal recognition particle subunit SRP54
MLEAISERMQKVFRSLRGEGHLTERHIDEAMAEIRRALLAADVALPVVKEFTARVRERAVGQEVLSSLSPGQQVTKIVHEEMTRLLGGESRPLKFKGFPAPVLLVGLQGTGKTTTCAKVGVFIKGKLGKHVLLVPADTA